ncbi:MAG: DUF3307 domain-containing protein [Anaerolineales bacterium]
MDPLFLAFLGHLVGDYVFQTDWMAENKKKHSFPCLVHSAVWAACVVLFAGWGWLPFLILLAFHFLQDRTSMVRNWMRLMGQDHFATGPYAPWSMVIIDNTFHLLQIWLVWKFLVWH